MITFTFWDEKSIFSSKWQMFVAGGWSRVCLGEMWRTSWTLHRASCTIHHTYNTYQFRSVNNASKGLLNSEWAHGRERNAYNLCFSVNYYYYYACKMELIFPIVVWLKIFHFNHRSDNAFRLLAIRTLGKQWRRAERSVKWKMREN